MAVNLAGRIGRINEHAVMPAPGFRRKLVAHRRREIPVGRNDRAIGGEFDHRHDAVDRADHAFEVTGRAGRRSLSAFGGGPWVGKAGKHVGAHPCYVLIALTARDGLTDGLWRPSAAAPCWPWGCWRFGPQTGDYSDRARTRSGPAWPHAAAPTKPTSFQEIILSLSALLVVERLRHLLQPYDMEVGGRGRCNPATHAARAARAQALVRRPTPAALASNRRMAANGEKPQPAAALFTSIR